MDLSLVLSLLNGGIPSDKICLFEGKLYVKRSVILSIIPELVAQIPMYNASGKCAYLGTNTAERHKMTDSLQSIEENEPSEKYSEDESEEDESGEEESSEEEQEDDSNTNNNNTRRSPNDVV